MDPPVDRKKPRIPSNNQKSYREQSSHLRKLALSERVNNLEVGSARGLALVYPRVSSQICWWGGELGLSVELGVGHPSNEA
jgi:hypothetical protein